MKKKSEKNWKQNCLSQKKKVLLFMGNCESLSETATSSVTMRSGSVSDGSEEAAIMYSNGMVTGSKVSV